MYNTRLMCARPVIDSLEFAANGGRIDAQVSIAELPRLLDVLDDPQGALNYTVKGGVDDRRRPVLDVSLDGRCRVRCQRCLGGMDYVIRQDARLLLCDQAGLDALDSAEHMDGHEEALDGILADAHLDVLALLEDEILLGLPIAPRHDEGACQAAGSGNGQEGVRHPFAVLEKLKHNQQGLSEE